MQIIKVSDYGQMSIKAAEIIRDQVAVKPNTVLGLVTGGTPEGMYEHLVDMYNKGEIDFSRVTTVNTDEYYKIHKDNNQSYSYYMETKFFSKVNVDKSRILLVDGMAEDPLEECRAYEKKVKETGGMDLLILGTGGNGHIAFNEPQCDDFTASTHMVDLSEETLAANARFFTSLDEMPRKAITMGIGKIMGAKKIVLMVSGPGKSDILDKILYGPVTPKVPGSILQFHQDVTVVADEAALSSVLKHVSL